MNTNIFARFNFDRFNARNNNVTRIANNNLTNNTVSFAKEHTTMNAFKSTITRAAKTLGAAALLVLATAAVKADVEIARWVGPAQSMGVAAGSTIMQVKVTNTSNYTVSGLQLSADLFTSNYEGVFPSSSVFSLGAYQSAWINMPIPAKATWGGMALYGQTLSGFLFLNGQIVADVSFVDVPPSANVQATQAKMTGTSNGADTFSITSTNNGYIASSPQQATVTTWLYADGTFGTSDPQYVTVPALAVGASATVKLTSQATQGYDIYGTVQIGTNSSFSFEF